MSLNRLVVLDCVRAPRVSQSASVLTAFSNACIFGGMGMGLIKMSLLADRPPGHSLGLEWILFRYVLLGVACALVGVWPMAVAAGLLSTGRRARAATPGLVSLGGLVYAPLLATLWADVDQFPVLGFVAVAHLLAWPVVLGIGVRKSASLGSESDGLGR